MSFESEINRDLIEVDAQVPTYFAWHGAVFACVADKFTREVIVSDDGNPEQIDLSLRARVELFTNHAFPKSGETIVFPVDAASGPLPDTATYRVRRTRSKQLAMLWVDCVDLNV